MNIIDFKKNMKEFYADYKKDPKIVKIPNMKFLMFNGKGHPKEQDFQDAANVLYTISYILKFKLVKMRLGIDYKVMPMELIWKLEKDIKETKYYWTMMIMQPDFITLDMVNEAIEISKTKLTNESIRKLKFEEYEEGICMQAFHLGNYNLMNNTLNNIIDFAKKNNITCEKFTHDIYLNDSRKTKTKNLKTIMRVRIINGEI